jgi:dynein heavy chain
VQSGLKLTNEPPKGLKTNLLSTYSNFEAEFLEGKQARNWRKLLFGLAFFHAAIQGNPANCAHPHIISERRKFGYLGWNKPYEFNESDLSISVKQLRYFMDSYEAIPFQALNFLTAEINYGGRITDRWDKRALRTILQEDFYSKKMLNAKYRLSNLDAYTFPADGKLSDYIAYIKALPINDPPAVFGLHENAEITSGLKETSEILATILSLQPRTSGASSNMPQIIRKIAAEIKHVIAKDIDFKTAIKKFPISAQFPLNSVLKQEILSYNK